MVVKRRKRRRSKKERQLVFLPKGLLVEYYRWDRWAEAIPFKLKQNQLATVTVSPFGAGGEQVFLDMNLGGARIQPSDKHHYIIPKFVYDYLRRKYIRGARRLQSEEG